MIPFSAGRGSRIGWAVACLCATVTSAACGRDLDPHADGRILLATGTTAKPSVETARKTESLPKAVDTVPDPLKGTEQIDPAKTGIDAEKVLQRMLPPRSDSPVDWQAGIEPLHYCGEPRLLPPCVPPPPCHPSQPPRPYDLIGARGTPTCGPIYRGPCEPRTGSHDDAHLPRMHRIHDRVFDWFYTSR